MSAKELSTEEKESIRAFYEKLDPLRGEPDNLLKAYKIITPVYDEVNRLLVMPHRECVEELKSRLGANEIKSRSVLDLGAGTGLCGQVLEEEGFENVDALDISREMLDEARKKNLYKNYFCGKRRQQCSIRI